MKTPTGTIKVRLTACNMGSECDEADFDAWASWVIDHIDDAIGFEVHEVEQARFGDAGADRVSGAMEEQSARIRDWLSNEGWGAFCADADAWPTRAA